MIEGNIIHQHLVANAAKLQWSKSHIIPYGLQFNVQAKGHELTVRVKKNLDDNKTYFITITDNVGRVVKKLEGVELDNIISEINNVTKHGS